MKLTSLLLGILLIACHGANQPRTLKIAVLDTPPGHSHSVKVIQVIKSNYAASCRLEVQLFPIYKNGNWTVLAFLSAIEESNRFSPEITNISWNTMYRRPYDPVVKELRTVSRVSFLVTASGQDFGTDDIDALSNTVMGKVPKALVIGALSENGRLAGDNVQGSLLTALSAPEGSLGSSFSAALFTAKLAETLCRKEDFDLHALFYNKKSSLQKYPGLEEILGN